MNIQVKKNKF